MNAASLKQKVNRILQKEKKFSKSKTSKGRIKGFDNTTAGYTFYKLWDAYYILYTCGNIAFRGMSVEDQDKKTEEIFKYLVEVGLSEFIEIVNGIKNQKAIKLKHTTI